MLEVPFLIPFGTRQDSSTARHARMDTQKTKSLLEWSLTENRCLIFLLAPDKKAGYRAGLSPSDLSFESWHSPRQSAGDYYITNIRTLDRYGISSTAWDGVISYGRPPPDRLRMICNANLAPFLTTYCPLHPVS